MYLANAGLGCSTGFLHSFNYDTYEPSAKATPESLAQAILGMTAHIRPYKIVMCLVTSEQQSSVDSLPKIGFKLAAKYDTTEHLKQDRNLPVGYKYHEGTKTYLYAASVEKLLRKCLRVDKAAKKEKRAT